MKTLLLVLRMFMSRFWLDHWCKVVVVTFKTEGRLDVYAYSMENIMIIRKIITATSIITKFIQFEII